MPAVGGAREAQAAGRVASTARFQAAVVEREVAMVVVALSVVAAAMPHAASTR